MKHLYVANDGTQFEDEMECKKHEGLPLIIAYDEEGDVMFDEDSITQCNVFYVPEVARESFAAVCESAGVPTGDFDEWDGTNWIIWSDTMDSWVALDEDTVELLAMANHLHK